MRTGLISVDEALASCLPCWSERARCLEVSVEDLPERMAGAIRPGSDRVGVAVSPLVPESIQRAVIAASALLALFGSLPVSLPCLDVQQVGAVIALNLTSGGASLL